MDPDRSRSLVLFVVFVLLLHRVLYLLGADALQEEEDPLGFSAGWAGRLAAVLLLLGCSCIAAFILFGGLAWAMALFAAALLFFCVCAVAFGRANARRARRGWEDALFRLLGTPLCAPVRLLFHALGLTAVTPVTEERILDLVDDVQEDDLIDESQKEMISAVFELDDLEVSEIMTHRTEIEAVEDTTPAALIIDSALENGFSRLPVYHKSPDDMVGILHVKDLLRLANDQSAATAPVTRFMRPAMFVPESCHARELLVQFKEKHTQMAIVVDEYGGTAGIVTMEDILEEIVGNIQDEFDNESEEMRPVKGGLICEGATDLEDIFEQFDAKMPEPAPDEDFDSVGGLILQRLGRFPTAGEDVTVMWGPLTFTVLKSDERRIETVLCRPTEEEDIHAAAKA